MTQALLPATDAPRRRRDLARLFAPGSIAVVGASRKQGSVGWAIMHNLIVGGFTGVVYPVNPKARSVMGVRCVPGVTDLDDLVDLAVVIVPADAVEEVLTQCADRGTRHFIIISAGFKEIGGEGKQREQRLQALARERDLAILGPNCLGLINTDPDVRMNASFARDMPSAGGIGLLSQSGALCTALLDYAKGRHIAFSRFVSFGNKADVSETDLLWALAEDPLTRVILMYIEDIADGRAFVDTAYEITHRADAKPILAIKTGRTPQGAAAAASHTGSLAGSDEVYDAVMAQAGVLRVESVKELFDCARIFNDPARPKGRRTAIVTNAGGPGIMATDACVRAGLELARFQDYTTKSLRFQLPPASNIKNPVDVIGDAGHERYIAALDAVSADEGVDQIVVIFTPQAVTDVKEVAQVIADATIICTKPIAACLMGLVDVAPGVELLMKRGIPTYIFPEDAVRALAAENRFVEWSNKARRPYRSFDVDGDAVGRVVADELAAGRTHVVELRALEVLQHYGFPVVPFRLAEDADGAVVAAQEMGYPVVLKIASPKVLHKTEVGGVRLDLEDEAAVRAAYDEIMSAVREKLGAGAEIWGVLVQKMLPCGKETIVGMTRDERFGPLLMFGLGGIYAEALKDVAFRMAPIREDEAATMIRGIRSFKLLQGVRGEPPADLDAIGECLLRLSQLVTDHPQIKELDINPLLAFSRGKGVVAADARIILSEA